MIFKRFLSIFVAVIFVFAALPSNSVIVSAASDAVSVTQDKPYKETLGAAYGGSMLVSFYAMGSDISVAANDADGNVIANISLNGYINSDSFTKLSVLYYIHTGKAFIYGGENDEYKETQTFTVDFNLLGHGSEILSPKVNYGSTAKMPLTPREVGYTFSGWFTDEECTSAFNFNISIT